MFRHAPRIPILFFAAACATQAATPETRRLSSPDITLLGVAPGTFRMGSDDNDPLRFAAELDARDVTLTKPYWLGRTEVTRDQWIAVMGKPDGPSFNGPAKKKLAKGEVPPPEEPVAGNLPMADVGWAEAIVFCDRLTERERAAGKLPAGYVYALPTEAQWEYACRAGATGLTPASEDDLDAQAWYMKTSGPWVQSMGPRLHAVGTKKANAWGFHDMLGNVREWVLDAPAPYSGKPVSDPLVTKTVPPNKSVTYPLRIMRGGAWIDNRRGVRAATRDWADPARYGLAGESDAEGKKKKDFRTGVVGFRLALVPEEQRRATDIAAKE